MRKMTHITLALSALAILPARASEVGLLIDKQFGESQSFSGTVSGNPATAAFDAVKPNGFGIRGAYTLVNLGIAEVALNATYHPETKGDGVLKLSTQGQTYSYHLGDYKNSYIAVGAQADWKLLINLHAGIEVRRESLKGVASDTGVASGTSDATYTRPWVSAGIGFSIPLPIVSPFVRLEAAYATSSKTLEANASDEDFLKSMAPKYQIGLYGGIRF